MLAGVVYNHADEELSACWQFAKQLMIEYNIIIQEEQNETSWNELSPLLGSKDENVCLWAHFTWIR